MSFKQSPAHNLPRPLALYTRWYPDKRKELWNINMSKLLHVHAGHNSCMTHTWYVSYRNLASLTCSQREMSMFKTHNQHKTRWRYGQFTSNYFIFHVTFIWNFVGIIYFWWDIIKLLFSDTCLNKIENLDNEH